MLKSMYKSQMIEIIGRVIRYPINPFLQSIHSSCQRFPGPFSSVYFSDFFTTLLHCTFYFLHWHLVNIAKVCTPLSSSCRWRRDSITGGLASTARVLSLVTMTWFDFHTDYFCFFVAFATVSSRGRATQSSRLLVPACLSSALRRSHHRHRRMMVWSGLRWHGLPWDLYGTCSRSSIQHPSRAPPHSN